MYNYQVAKGSFATPQALQQAINALPVTAILDVGDGFVVSFSRQLTEDEDKSFFEIIHPPSALELARRARYASAKVNAAAIPDWAIWTESQAQTWGNTNIGTPLTTARTSLTAMSTLNLTTFKSAMTIVLNILDAMWVMLWALTRMTIALRDAQWPDLPEIVSGAQAQKIK